MYLLQFFAAGSWIVCLGSYMRDSLAFDSIIALAYSMIGVASIIATLFVGVVADRFFPAQKVLSVTSVSAACTLVLLSSVTQSHVMFLAVMLLHCLFYMSAIPLLATITFNAVSNPGQEFPGIRVFGTVGWIAAGLLIGMVPGAAHTRFPMLIGAAAYAVLGVYSLTLPLTPPKARGQAISLPGLFGLDILAHVRGKSFWIFIACVLLIVTPKVFYDSFANSFLAQKGMAFRLGTLTFEPTAIQTSGQVAEAFTMLLIPVLIARVGIKWVMVLGMAGWVVRFLLFANGFSGAHAIVPMLMVGILMHGLSYDFFFVSGQIYLDRLFGPEMRGRVQAFYAFILQGLGVVLGGVIASGVYHRFASPGDVHDWAKVWLVPAFGTAVVAMLFVWQFREPRKPASRSSRHRLGLTQDG